MPLLTESIFDWRVLTRVINEVDTPNSWLQRTLFGASNAHATDTLELHRLTGGREFAPFVRKGSAAQLIKGYGHKVEQVMPPTIRLKMQISAAKYLAKVAPGVISAVPGGAEAAVRASAMANMARDTERLERYVVDAIEWMCGRALTRTITYNPETLIAAGAGEETDSFNVAFEKDSSTSFASAAGGAGVGWTTGDPAIDIRTGKVILDDLEGQAATLLICGENAGKLFSQNPHFKAASTASAGGATFVPNMPNTDIARLQQAGPIFLGGQVLGEGVVREGSYAGVDVVTYSRKVTFMDVDGSVAAADQPIIDTNSAYLVSVPNAPQNFSIEYGAIEDDEAFFGNQIVGSRYSKMWTESDPSATYRLVEARPLPMLWRPNSVIEITGINAV